MGNEERRIELEELRIMKAESLVMNEGLMKNEMMKEGWMTMNLKSIMNEEWRMIMNKIIKEPTTDEEFMIGWELRDIVEAMHDEDMWNEVPQMIMNKMMKETMADKLMMEEALMDETMDEKLMMDEGLLINEELMDYDQSIMDEMMVWHRITPVMNQQPGTLTTPPWISRSMRFGSSAFTPVAGQQIRLSFVISPPSTREQLPPVPGTKLCHTNGAAHPARNTQFISTEGQFL